MSFTDKIILITGGSSGIGADAAIHLSKLGALVAITGRDATKLHGVAEQIIAAGSPEPLEIVADVTTDAERIISETIKKFGKLDVLVNSAGICKFSRDELLGTLEVFDDQINTNVRGVLALTKAAIPHLAKTKGNVVNISSIASSVAMRSATAYCMSKAALDHFTRCAAIELASKGIRVNAINPGVVVTPIFKTSGMSDEALEKFIKMCDEMYPVGRVAQVKDTSEAISFLASDAASFITGHLLTLDGGKSLVK